MQSIVMHKGILYIGCIWIRAIVPFLRELVLTDIYVLALIIILWTTFFEEYSFLQDDFFNINNTKNWNQFQTKSVVVNRWFTNSVERSLVMADSTHHVKKDCVCFVGLCKRKVLLQKKKSSKSVVEVIKWGRRKRKKKRISYKVARRLIMQWKTSSTQKR